MPAGGEPRGFRGSSLSDESAYRLVIADDHVDIEFGTGALKITPAHDKADFEIGIRHNLEIIDVLTPDGHVNCPEVPELHGLDRFVGRKKAAAKKPGCW